MKAVRTSLPAGLQDLGYQSRSSFGGIPPADLEGAFSFYEQAPSGEVRVSQLEHLARQRLKILQLIDRKHGGKFPSLDEFEQQEGGNILAAGVPALFKESPEDELLSHYLLRMGFARSTEFAEWFLKQEEIFFHLRLRSAGTLGLKTVLERTEISRDVKQVASFADLQSDGSLGEDLRRLHPEISPSSVFYVLPFTRISASLVARRQVVLRRGFAYVPEAEMYGILTARFRAYLSQCMRLAETEYKSFSQDERMARILKYLSPTALTSGNSKTANLADSQTLNLANFNVSMHRSFPPCMRAPMEWMRERKSHLKNTGRNQLYSFVRAAGMTLEESVTLWKREFTNDKAVAVDKFDKDYLYTIRWTYGKTGRMKPAPPMSCSTVIGLEHPGNDQSHGCVFKVLDSLGLSNLLKKWAIVHGFGDGGGAGGLGWIQDVVSKAAVTHEYQLACVEFFRNIHPGASGDGVGNSPIAFFAESTDYWKKREEAVAAGRNA